MKYNIPEKILIVLQKLESAGYEAFLVGGSVRDLLRRVEPKDWDITTNAKPKEILKVFPDGKYENDFGTVVLPLKYVQVKSRKFTPSDDLGSKVESQEFTNIDKKETRNKIQDTNKLQDTNYKYISENKKGEMGLKVLSDSIKIKQEDKKELISIAKTYSQKIDCPAHNDSHSQSVVNTALQIAGNYKQIDKNIVELLAWFHDTGRAIGPAKEHIKNSQQIVKKEFAKYFNKEGVEKFILAVQHDLMKKSVFLEQQILKEADIIEGLNIQRINSFLTDKEIEEHLNWIKNRFNQKGYYQYFITPVGKKLLSEAVKKFNTASFKIDIPEPRWENSENVEITTYRIESTYSDNRRPDEVKFAKTLEEDLSRRDFTCNAIALRLNFEFPISNFDSNKNEIISNNQIKYKNNKTNKTNIKALKNSDFNQNSQPKAGQPGAEKLKIQNFKIIDLFNGQQDIKNQAIRAVGDANERFNEDALRMMRAVRFASQLSQGDDLQFLKNRKGEGYQNQKTGYQSTVISSQPHTVNREPITDNQKWWIGERTFDAIKKNAHLLKHISPERISDEFQKIILSDRPAWGVELLVETGLMKYIIPEVLETIGVRQNRHHYNGPYNTVYKHMLAALKTCPSKKLEVRLAAFFHDIGKPKSKRGHGYNATFYGHEYIGARMTKQIMERLKFPRKVIDKTVLLVKNHMFYYNVDEVGEKGVRKVIRKVGLENINDLIDVRIGDRLGSGVAKAVPYKLRHFKYMVEKVSKDPISVKDLKINGDILIKDYNFKPGPQMGAILEILLAEVLDNPKLNTLEYLSKRALELQKEDLQQLRQLAKDKIKEEKQKEDQQTKGKYWVK